MDENSVRSRLTKLLKQTLRLVFSHLGLLILVIILTISGGLIFQLLEKHASIQKCEEGEGKFRGIVKKLTTTIFDYVWLNTTNSEYYSKITNQDWLNQIIRKERKFLEDYNKDIPAMLIEYRKSIIEIYNIYQYSGQNCINDTSWILESSLLFTLSLLTTIGYGHITPITWEGMVVCICFSMIGIPLCLLSVSKLSGDLADMFRAVFSKLIKFLFGRCLSKKTRIRAFRPKLQADKFSISKNYSSNLDFVKNSVDSQSDSDDSNSENDSYDDEEKRITVPLIVIMIIIVIYVMAGSYMFQYLEGWSAVTSSYFSFTTMATIGFGDIVPGIKDLGKSDSSNKVNRNLIIAAIYLFVGIAILAMCFDLLQETFIIKMVKFTKRVKNESISELKRIELRINKIRPYLLPTNQSTTKKSDTCKHNVRKI